MMGLDYTTQYHPGSSLQKKPAAAHSNMLVRIML